MEWTSTGSTDCGALQCRNRKNRSVVLMTISWQMVIVTLNGCSFLAGTFITLDICISRLRDVGTVDIRGTVEKIRSQRAYSIQMPDQYVFCHLALIEYALSQGMLSSVDLADFDHREDESD